MNPNHTLSNEQLRILRHMLGINDPSVRDPKPHRDYYCANPGNQELHELKRLGMVELCSTRDGYEWFRTTDAGKQAAMASHRAIRWTKRQRVYSKYLDCKDICDGLTFKEFLTSPVWAESRREA